MPLREIPASLVMVRAGGKDYPAVFQRKCHVCMSEHRLSIERDLVDPQVVSYGAVVARIPEGAGISLVNVQNHIRNGHLPTSDYQPPVDRTPQPAAPSGRIFPEPGQGQWIYMIQFGNRIKIGFSTDPRCRIAFHPYDRVLAVFPGSRATETYLHRRFAHLLPEHSGVHREWFVDDPELLTFAEEMDQTMQPGEVDQSPRRPFERWGKSRV